MKKIKFGVIGLGHIGLRHSKIAHEHPDSETIACCDILPEREEKLKELGYELPTLPASKGIYKRCLIDGKNLYVSGHISVNTDGSSITGKLGKDLNEEQGKAAARQCGLAILSSIKDHFGTLDKVKRVMKLLGMVNATPEYEKHPIVINGCKK